ncbi:TIGR03936 family radical SAM-associated protein [Lachnospiraceae bacterium JLR.KK008]
MKVRIQFSKHGAMKFIGHLDIMRYFQKAIRRAGIDIAYTTGFSPHQIMSFAAPLGVGLESDGEYMDIEVNSHAGGTQMREALNGAMAEGIEILSVRLLPQKTPNAMASVAAAGYLVRFRSGYEPDFPYEEALVRFYEQSELPFVKKTKKQELTLNLKPAIYELHMQKDAIYMLVDASSAGNIKPATVIRAFYQENGRELPEFALEITRTDTYMNIGTDEDRRLVPLRDAGEEF